MGLKKSTNSSSPLVQIMKMSSIIGNQTRGFTCAWDSSSLSNLSINKFAQEGAILDQSLSQGFEDSVFLQIQRSHCNNEIEERVVIKKRIP